MIEQLSRFTVDPAWQTILRDLGIDPAAAITEARLPADLFARENATLTADEFFRLWNAIEACYDRQDFALRLGQMISAEVFHPLFFGALACPNFNVCMQRVSVYKKIVGPFRLDVAEDSRSTSLGFEFLTGASVVPDSMIAMELVFIVGLIRFATREQIVPMHISSTAAQLQGPEFTEYFGVQAVQGKRNLLQFTAADARLPFLTKNARMWEFFEPELKKRLAAVESEISYAERVETVLFELLPTGRSSIEDVSEKLLIPTRTLQRALRAESTSFQQVRNRIRERLAHHYLANSALPGEQISFLLGYDDPKSFARAFRLWTGKSPGKVRSILRAARTNTPAAAPPLA